MALTCGFVADYKRVFQISLSGIENGNRWQTRGMMRQTLGMDKAEYGKRLKSAMAAESISRDTLALLLNVDVRTVTNWTNGYTKPSDDVILKLRRRFPGFDTPGDAVEIAVRQSPLTEDRQDTVLGFYKRQLREQREEQVS